jgi:hypothetical protein
MSAKEEFIIPQKLSLWDYYRVSIYVTVRSKRISWLFYVLPAVGILNLCINLLASTKKDSPLWVMVLQSLLPILVFLVFLFGVSLIICIIIKLLKPGIFKNMTYQFTHWGLYTKSDLVDDSVPWRNLVKVKETKSFIFLYFSKEAAHVIQKKMFRHVDELEHFRNFMNAHINR